jgi:hypothetical protein
MRYKQQTVSRLEAQATKLETLKRMIEMNNISGTEAVALLDGVVKEIKVVNERLSLEHEE